MAKAVAANGVRNSPEKPAEMPVISISRGASSTRSSRPTRWDIAAPSCTATPSRPALPPKRCVSQVAHMTKGTSRSGISSLSACPTSNTMPMPFSQPAPYFLYAQAISAPTTPRKGKNQAVCASLTAPRYSSTRPNRASTAPTMTPVGMAAAVKIRVFFILSTSQKTKKPMLPRTARAARRSHQLNAVPASRPRGTSSPVFIF